MNNIKRVFERRLEKEELKTNAEAPKSIGNNKTFILNWGSFLTKAIYVETAIIASECQIYTKAGCLKEEIMQGANLQIKSLIKPHRPPAAPILKSY